MHQSRRLPATLRLGILIYGLMFFLNSSLWSTPSRTVHVLEERITTIQQIAERAMVHLRGHPLALLLIPQTQCLSCVVSQGFTTVIQLLQEYDYGVVLVFLDSLHSVATLQILTDYLLETTQWETGQLRVYQCTNIHLSSLVSNTPYFVLFDSLSRQIILQTSSLQDFIHFILTPDRSQARTQQAIEVHRSSDQPLQRKTVDRIHQTLKAQPVGMLKGKQFFFEIKKAVMVNQWLWILDRLRPIIFLYDSTLTLQALLPSQDRGLFSRCLQAAEEHRTPWQVIALNGNHPSLVYAIIRCSAAEPHTYLATFRYNGQPITTIPISIQYQAHPLTDILLLPKDSIVAGSVLLRPSDCDGKTAIDTFAAFAAIHYPNNEPVWIIPYHWILPDRYCTDSTQIRFFFNRYLQLIDDSTFVIFDEYFHSLYQFHPATGQWQLVSHPLELPAGIERALLHPDTTLWLIVGIHPVNLRRWVIAAKQATHHQYRLIIGKAINTGNPKWETLNLSLPQYDGFRITAFVSLGIHSDSFYYCLVRYETRTEFRWLLCQVELPL